MARGGARRRARRRSITFRRRIATCWSSSSPTAAAEPTEIVVRVIGKDSMFIGTNMGGMRIALRDAHTGELLANGHYRRGDRT